MAKITIYITVRNTLRTRSFFLLCLNHQCLHGPLSLFCHVSASPLSLLQQACFQLLMVVCTGDARQLRVNISMHSRSLLARAPVRNSLNLALPSGTRTCSQFTEYEYLPPPKKFSSNLHDSRRSPILVSKRRISPKGEGFSCLWWAACYGVSKQTHRPAQLLQPVF